MRITNKLCRACGTGYKMTTRECGKPKSGWKIPKRRQEKKKLREFLRKYERNIEMQSEKFVMGLEYEIKYLSLNLAYRKEMFKWEMYELADDLYCQGGFTEYEIQKKLIAHREFLLASIEEDERELAKLIEFHISYRED